MIKSLIAVIGMSVATVCLASPELDNQLLEAGIIDNNYRYTDQSLATEFFHLNTERLNQTLPMSVSQDMELNEIIMTPYYATSVIRYPSKMTSSEKSSLKTYLMSSDNLQTLCKRNFYIDKFISVNNVVLTYNYKDATLNDIASITLNNNTCAPFQ